jgi:hypothetical protein
MPRKRDSEESSRDIDRTVWMSRAEAAQVMGVSQNWIKPLVDQGEIKGLQRGKWLYIERKSAAAYVRRQKGKR